MLATNNILAPATGKPIIAASQDMVLGMYYLTLMKEEESEAQLKYFYSFEDAISAHETGVIKLHDRIVVRDEQGERLETTVGRIIFNETVRNAIFAK